MSKGKPWDKGYKAPNKEYGCPNGAKKCCLCSNPELAAYKIAKAAPLTEAY